MVIDWSWAGLVTGAAVVGGLVGGRLAARVEPDALRRGFGWFVLGMASLILAQEVGSAVGAAVATICVGHRDVAGMQAIWALSVAPTDALAQLTNNPPDTPTGNIATIQTNGRHHGR